MGTEASVHRRQTAAAELREFIRGLIKLRSEHNGVDAAQALVEKQEGLSPFQRQMLQDRVRGIVSRVEPRPQESPSESPTDAAAAEPHIEMEPAATASEALPSQPPRSVTPQPEASRTAVTTVLDALVAKGLEQMNADLCQVYIQDNDALTLRAEAPGDSGASGPARLSRKVGLAGQVGSLGRAVALIDLSQLSGAETIWASRGVRRLTAVGVGVAGDIGSGVLIAGRVSSRSFTEPELDEMDHLAQEVSSALASADLLSRAEELAVLKERMKLAREIHDGLANDLSAVVALFKYHDHRRTTDPEDAERLLERMRTLSEGALQSARDILATLRPRHAPAVDMVEAVRRHVDDFASTYGLTAVVRIEGEATEVPVEEGDAIYQILRESLTNVRKHSNATTIEVHLDLRRRPYTLQVDDDGVGVDLSALEDKLGSFGLMGMRERAELLGGWVDVGSSAMGGARITFRGPQTPLGGA